MLFRSGTAVARSGTTPHCFLEPMDYTHEIFDQGFDRLQRLLLAMKAGDALRAAEAAQLSGLNEGLCRAVLEGLTRAGLMAHAQDDERFIRRSLDAAVS